MTVNQDRRVVQCNMACDRPSASAGARAYLVRPNGGNGNDRIVILVRSRSGRWVKTWEDIRRLKDFRVKTLPPEHPMHGDDRLWDHSPETMAEQLNNARAALT